MGVCDIDLLVRDVQTVIVDGRTVIKGRQLLTADLVPMRDRATKQYALIMESFDKAMG
jgi:5-methylthioadenosine/S-adenosylhomocysteine deaminase